MTGEVIASYSAGRAAKLAGITYRQLDHWARTGFIEPSLQAAAGTGTDRLYSFTDLLALRAAARLRKDGLPLQTLRKVVAKIRSMTDVPTNSEALAGTLLVWNGTDVMISTPKEVISLLRKPGQAYFGFVVDLAAVCRDLEERVWKKAA